MAMKFCLDVHGLEEPEHRDFLAFKVHSERVMQRKRMIFSLFANAPKDKPQKSEQRSASRD
jgi:hypothetical protein